MKRNPRTVSIGAIAVLILAATVGGARLAAAHCDTLDGPVVASAKVALEQGDVTPVLKWVGPEHEQEITSVFDHVLAVRELGAEAKAMADRYFFETLVRIHREGEGAPYTGLKPGGAVDPAVTMADQALESGSVDRLANALSAHVDAGIRERFARALRAKKHSDESVDAGRDFVEAYVGFTHYVEELHLLATSNSEHHGRDGGETAAIHQH